MELNRVELHVHLDGAVTHETIYELMKEKKMKLPGNGSFEDLKKALIIREPKDLAHFLAPFEIYIPILQDLKVAERVAYEFCRETARNKILYAEARYAPQNFLPPNQNEVSRMSALEEVIKAISRGFTRGEEEFGVKVRSILCGLNGDYDNVEDCLRLCQKFRGEEVVAIDMAIKQGLGHNPEEVELDQRSINVFEEARKSGIHRTMHAGESGGPEMVKRALDVFSSERIGHGYHTLDDETLFKRCLRERVHFECCPVSSLLTGSVKLQGNDMHPIMKFAEYDANFSINSDDPTVTGQWVGEDYNLVQSWGLNESHFKKANLNAAESCFLPEHEKRELLKTMKKLWK